jgi:hypothetical protein
MVASACAGAISTGNQPTLELVAGHARPCFGKIARLPAQSDDLIRYAAVLELQYSRICTQHGIARRRQMAATAWRLIGLLGLTEAAEPLSPRLLMLLERHRR